MPLFGKDGESQQAGCLGSTCSQCKVQDRLFIYGNKSSFMTQKRLFLDELITGAEKWITFDNVACKRQWVDKDKSPKAELHGRKMLCV